MRKRFGVYFTKGVTLLCLFSFITSQRFVFSDPPEDKPAALLPAAPETPIVPAVPVKHANTFKIDDISLSAARLPTAFEIFLVHMFKLSNIRLGAGESVKTRVSEDEQLDIFNQMIHLIEMTVKNKKEYPKDKAPISSIEEYIRLKYPLQANSRNVEGDYEYYNQIYENAQSPIFYDVDPFIIEDKKNPTWPFADDTVRSKAQSYETKRTRYLDKALKSSEKTVSGMVFFSFFGSLYRYLGRGTDYAEFFTQAGIINDFASVASTIRNIVNAEEDDEALTDVEEPVLKNGSERQTKEQILARTSRPSDKMQRMPQHPKGQQQPPKILGPDQKPIKTAEEIAAEEEEAAEADSKWTAADAERLTTRIAAKTRKAVKKFGKMEQRFIEYILSVGKSNKPQIKMDLINLVQGGLNSTVEKLSKLSHMMSEAAKELGVETSDGEKAYLDLWCYIADEYMKDIYGSDYKNILWSILTSENTEANDLATFAEMRRHFGPAIKQYDQIMGSELGDTKLGKTVNLQQSNGKVLPPITIQKILESDPNQYGLRLRNFRYRSAKAGKGLTFVPAEGKKDESSDWEPVAVKIKDPAFDRMLDFDTAFIEKHKEKLAAILAVSSNYKSRKMTEEEVSRFFSDIIKQLRSENSDLSVVADKHNRLGPMYEEIKFVRYGGKIYAVRFHVPKAWPAAQKSKVIVTDLIQDPKEVQDLPQPEHRRAVATATQRLYFIKWLFGPMQKWVENPGVGEDELEGVANFDAHAGNELITDITFARANEFEELLKHEGVSKNAQVTVIDVHLPDWGLADNIEFRIVKNIALLAAGARTNSARVLTNALWNLSTFGFREDSASESRWWHLSRWLPKKESRNLPSYAGKRNTITSKFLFNLKVWAKSWQMFSMNDTMTEEEWIKWAMQYIEFDEKLLLIKRGAETIKSFQKSANGHGKEYGKVLDQMSKAYGSDFTKMVRRDQGHWAFYGGMVPSTILHYMRWPFAKGLNACASALMVFAPKNDKE